MNGVFLEFLGHIQNGRLYDKNNKPHKQILKLIISGILMLLILLIYNKLHKNPLMFFIQFFLFCLK